MNFIQLISLPVGGMVIGFVGLFAISAIREKKPRAVLISIAGFLVLSIAWLAVYVFNSPTDNVLIIPLLVAVLFILLFYLPSGARKSLRIDDNGERVDERDVIFAREEYLPGTEKYEKYYAMHPEFKAIDDRIRALPSFLKPGGRYYDSSRSQHIKSAFKILEDFARTVDGNVSSDRIQVESAEMTLKVKEWVRRMGAGDVGIAELKSRYIYSHVGRGPESWGAPIENNHRFAVVFALEMDYNSVRVAPRLPITEETVLQYFRGAQISTFLAHQIRTWGYSARAHVANSNYQIMLPPVAHDAGLGELGRFGFLISPRFGARIRLGAVTTDLPLIPDKPITFGVQDFCEKCSKCATNCPAGAIEKGNKVLVRGVEKWKLNVEKCLMHWRILGTDCGLCMRVCPFSHPPTFVHNIVRTSLRHSSFARTVSVYGDDLFYGQKLS